MKKILYLSGMDPFEKIPHGGMVVCRNNYKALIEYYGEENVICILISDKKNVEKENVIYLPKHKNKYQYFFNALCLKGNFNRKTEKDILKIAKTNKVQRVFVDSSIYGSIVKKLTKAGYPCMVYYHNVERDFARLIIKKEGKVKYPQYLSYWYNEKLSMKYSVCNISINPRDGKILNQYYGKEPDVYISAASKDRYDQLKDNTAEGLKEKRMLFVGNAGLSANYDGIKWFVDNVMIELEDYHLTIVGKGFENVKDVFERYNVTVEGTVPETDSYYYNTGVVVSPIFYGSGMKTKTAETFMFGKILFASDEALEGYEIENIPGVFRCNTKEEFVTEIRKFFKKYSSFIDMSDAIRKYFLQELEESVIKRKYKQVFDELEAKLSK